MRRDPALLLDILDAATKIAAFSRGVDYGKFLQDEQLQLALQKLFENIGEAARNVSDETKSQHPEIPWKRMIGMRDIIIHQYSRVNLARVWEAANHDIPDLIRQIKPLVPPEDSV